MPASPSSIEMELSGVRPHTHTHTHTEHVVSGSTDGSRIGRLHRVRTLSDLEALLASNLGSSELLALLMPRELLRHANLPLLRQVPLAGILLEPIAPLYTPYSPAARSPLRHLAPTASASFDWNPHGDAFIEERLQFAVLQVRSDLCICRCLNPCGLACSCRSARGRR